MTFWKIYTVAFSAIAVFSGIGRLVLYFKKPGSVTTLDLVNGFYSLLMLPALWASHGIVPSVFVRYG